MAKRMAVSAETRATVTSTRASNNMRKYCRIAPDYNFAGDLGLDRIIFSLARVFPFVMASMAGPRFLVHRDWNPSVGRSVRDKLLQFTVAHIQRLAFGALRLLVLPDPLNLKRLW